MRERNQNRLVKKIFRNYFESLISAVLIALLIRAFVLAAYRIPTISMQPTLLVGDFVFAYKLPYGVRIPFTQTKLLSGASPQRGALVAFRFPNDERLIFIKRVAALPGDTIEIKNRRLYINGEAAIYEKIEDDLKIEGQEYYLFLNENIKDSVRQIMVSKEGAESNYGPEIVPPGHFFALGDNRNSSDDSRYWGMIPLKNIESRVFLIWLSLDWKNKQNGWPSIRWERIFSSVD